MSANGADGRRRRLGWAGRALVAAAGGAAGAAALGGVRAARRALAPPDERGGVTNRHERVGDFPERTHTPEPFRERYRLALGNERMRAGVLRFQRNWRNARDTSFADLADSEEMGEVYGRGPAPVGVDVNTGAEAAAAGAEFARRGRSFEELRDELAAIKDRTIAESERYLAEFTAAAEQRGCVVYRSSSAEDAGRYVADLCARKGIRRVAKSKSMLTEEIGLNPALEGRGLHIAETDLGEWLVQLAEERPSHIIGPALHMDRHRTAELLARATGQPLDPDDIGAQVGLARRTLREEFLTAGLGVSGANALICETGTTMIVTNEGNAELVTSLPDVHVVIVGIEKLLPTIADAMKQVRLLARSGTGQAISVYTTFISGPDRPGKEIHYVFVDNGRSAMAADPDFRSALRCIRCGACADVCPPYQVVGGHAFGYIYSGAIGL
ncbi:MAG: Predicted L-lactate dehydrogenase, Iron-sulfur cluster-binding subunit YkgF, partial [uncultured Thermomicrobiales bacterium]